MSDKNCHRHKLHCINMVTDDGVMVLQMSLLRTKLNPLINIQSGR